MVGANYMGGKRNAIRARGKDREARLQKSFFGKQRLKLLSQGLLSTHSTVGTSRDGALEQGRSSAGQGIEDISFAHARQKLSVKSGSSTTISRIPDPDYVPSLLRSSPSSDFKRIRTHISTTHKQPKSKILQALDTTEPSSMKQLLEKIRSTPNLAGLSQRSNRAKRHSKSSKYEPEPEDDQTIERTSDRGVPSDDEYSIQPQNDPSERSYLGDFDDAPYGAYCGSQGMQFDHDAVKNPYAEEGPSYWYPQDQEEPSRSYAQSFSSMTIPESSSIAGDHQYFDEHNPQDFDYGEPPSSRPYQLLSSPPTSVEQAVRYGMPVGEAASPGSFEVEDPAKETAELLLQHGSDEHKPNGREVLVNIEDEEFDERGVPYEIRLPRPGDGASASRCVYGTLFLQPDPWATIGEILGLRMPGGRREENDWAEPAEPRRNGSMWSTSLLDMDPEDDEAYNACVQSEAVGHSPERIWIDEEGVWEDQDGGPDGQVDMDMGDEPLGGMQPFGVCDEEVEDQFMEELPLDDWYDPEGGFPTLAANVHPVVDPPMTRQESTKQQGIEQDTPLCSPERQSNRAQTSTPSPTPSNEPGSPPASTPVCSPVKESNGPNYLTIAELEEQNGRYVGPSLFEVGLDDEEL